MEFGYGNPIIELIKGLSLRQGNNRNPILRRKMIGKTTDDSFCTTTSEGDANHGNFRRFIHTVYKQYWPLVLHTSKVCDSFFSLTRLRYERISESLLLSLRFQADRLGVREPLFSDRSDEYRFKQLSTDGRFV